MNLHSIHPPSPDVSRRTRQPNAREVVWLRAYMEPVRNRTELAKLKRVRIEPGVPLWECVVMVLVAAAIGFMLALGHI